MVGRNDVFEYQLIQQVDYYCVDYWFGDVVIIFEDGSYDGDGDLQGVEGIVWFQEVDVVCIEGIDYVVYEG